MTDFQVFYLRKAGSLPKGVEKLVLRSVSPVDGILVFGHFFLPFYISWRIPVRCPSTAQGTVTLLFGSLRKACLAAAVKVVVKEVCPVIVAVARVC